MKRGLEKLYRRVEKDVSEEVLEVVWGDMQHCLMVQCAKFNKLIQDCYPGEQASRWRGSEWCELLPLSLCRLQHHPGVRGG